MGPQKIKSVSLYPIRGGTGSARLAPPWSRDQVKWLGTGYYVLRLATDERSRWCLGAGFHWNDVFPHERTFRHSAVDKSALIAQLRMNPWPVHLASESDPELWRAGLGRLVEKETPIYDTGHVTLWRVDQVPTEIIPRAPLIVLDGHHSRKAQKHLGLAHVFGWVEPLYVPQLHVRSIERAGVCAKWLEACVKEGSLRALTQAPDPHTWSMDRSLAFEVIQVDKRWWCEVVQAKGSGTALSETVVDALMRLAKGRLRLRTSASFEEIIDWLEKLEVDTALRLPPPNKTYIRERAVARQLFPQKATYFFPKIPFGLLVEDLK